MIITDMAVNRSISVYVLILCLVVGGMLAYAGLPREAAPEIDIPVIMVTTPYPGVSPQDIETLITQPLEKELIEVDDIDELRSTSADGVSLITVKFSTDADLDEALQQVRDKVDRAQLKIPKDAEDTAIQSVSTADFPMMIVNVTGVYNILRLRQVAEDIQDNIEKIRGVMDVKLAGGLEREIQIRVDPLRLNYYGVALFDIVNAIRSENINMPGGEIKVGDSSLLVRVPGEFEHPDEIATIIVKMRAGNPVFLSDVATVHDTFKDQTTASRLDKENNISLAITKQGGANIIAISDAIKTMLDENLPLLPPSTKFVILNDESDKIRDMVKELENSMLTGLLLVIGVIMFAMGFRNSVLVGIAIPLSMLLTFLVLQMLGVTLNMIVLFSLILALGMLVDNGIVIVENIYRHASQGKSNLAAALEGTREVAWPVATSTLTTVAAFGPLLFWPGIMGSFMGFLPLTVIITLLSSLFVALVINPVLCVFFLRPGKTADEEQLLKELKQGGQKGFLGGYIKTLNLSLKRRYLTMVIGALSFVATIGLFVAADLGVVFFSETTPRAISIGVDTGAGTRFSFTDKIVAQIEEVVGSSKNIKHVVADVGSGGQQQMGGSPSSAGQPNKGNLSIEFLDVENRTESPLKTIEKFRQGVAHIAGARIDFLKPKMGPPTGAPVTILLTGPDYDKLGDLAGEIRRTIEDTLGVVDLKDDYSAGRPELRVTIDRERAKLLGTGTQRVADTIRTAINGTKASVLREGDEEYDIVVRLDQRFRNNTSDIENLFIPVGARKDPDKIYLVPLREVAHVKPAGGTGSIRHLDTDRVVTISGYNEGRRPDQVLADVKTRLIGYTLPEGYEMDFAGESKDQEEAAAFLGNAFLGALFLIVLILVTQFNSLLIPSIIMIQVIMSLVGVFLGQIIHGMPFGVIMTGLGVISLAGVVVNNGIVLIDYIGQLRHRGYTLIDALVTAGVVRLRPVLLTAITTVLGLVPMALGISIDFSTLSIQAGGEMAEFWRAMAIAVIYGLAVATVLTLVGVPVLYAIFDDIGIRIRTLFGIKNPPSSNIDSNNNNDYQEVLG